MIGHKWGCQVPNGPDWTAGDIADVYGDGVFIIMNGELDKLPKMRELMPNALIGWRAYLEDWNATDPRQWARDCAQVYRQIKQYTKLITWANEQNLRAESGGVIGADPEHLATKADYERILEWNMAWLDEFISQPGCDDAILIFPALAYGHSDDQDDHGDGFVGLDILRPVIEACDYGAIHLYVSPGKPIDDEWEGLGRLKHQRPWFLGKPLLITETGCFEAGTQHYPERIRDIGYYLQGEPDIHGFCFFIHADPTKHHQQNDMSRNPQPYDEIRHAIKMPRPELVEMPPVIPDRTILPLAPGRGLWCWYLTNNGGLDGLIAKAHATKSRYLLIKAADGDHRFGGITRDTVRAVSEAGLTPILWHYIYGDSPNGEVNIALAALDELQPGGWVADVEAEYEQSYAPSINGRAYADAVSNACHKAGIPFGYSPVPVIDYHQRLPFLEFNAVSDFVMPQFYSRMLGADWTFTALWEQWTRWSKVWRDAGYFVPPILPVGEAYRDNQSGLVIPTSDIGIFEKSSFVINSEVPTYWVADFMLPEHINAMSQLGGHEVVDPKPTSEDEKIKNEAWQLCTALEDLANRAKLIGMPWRAHGYEAASLAGKTANKVNE